MIAHLLLSAAIQARSDRISWSRSREGYLFACSCLDPDGVSGYSCCNRADRTRLRFSTMRYGRELTLFYSEYLYVE